MVRNLLGAHKKGDNGDDVTTDFTDRFERQSKFDSFPERDLYERLCRRDNITVVSNFK